MGRPRHKTKAKTQSQNSGPPDMTASSHSSGQSSNDDASNFSSNGLLIVSLIARRSISVTKVSNCCKVSQCLAINGQKCQGLLQKEVYIATQEAADFSKRNKFLKKAIDKEQLKCNA